MQLNIDQVEYGNPSREEYAVMNVTSFLDSVIADIKHYTPPANSSTGTREELNLLVQYSADNSKIQQCQDYDGELVSFIRDLYVRRGYDQKFIIDTTQSIIDDVMPTLTKMKYFFQRPRPNQLARYYKLNLFPSFSAFVSSPSYPSGHTTLTKVIGEVLGNKFPETYQWMRQFVNEVSESRLYMGVHYPSDNNMAMILSEKIVAYPQFKKKYGL